MKKLKPIVLASALSCILSNGIAQVASDSTKTDFLEMSLEDLMNIPIVSASKEKESSFNSPLTSCVITRQEMNNMGATSIPDALKFCPAIIVREYANGSYDVSIRGGVDGLPSYQFQNTNTTILAMIDNRPVFSNFQGGTYWQNLPIEIADVERIEVIYGPNAPMYGPNAVSGVINIITKKEYTNKPTVVHANVQSGLSSMYSAYIGHKISDKLEINASGNVAIRMRDKEEYYFPIQDRYTDSVNVVATEKDLTFPLRRESSKKNGLNFNINYALNKRVNLNFNSSYNSNQTLSFLQVQTPLNFATNTSNSHMLKGEVYGINFQSSYLSGTQGLLGNERPYFHDYKTWDNYVDYNFKVKSKISIRPAFSFQSASIDDKKYTVDENRVGLFNNSGTITNFAGSLKLDYKTSEQFRLIAAIRADKFSKPNKVYPSYQFALNYSPSQNHLIRFVAGRSFNSSFLVPTYADLLLFNQSSTAFDPNTGVTNVTNFALSLKGNPDRKLLQNDMFELGYRTQLGKNIQLDVSLFNQTFRNFSVFVVQPADVKVGFVPFPTPTATINIKQTNTPQNLDMIVRQNGVSMSLLFVSTNKMLTFKPHFTIQETRIEDYQKYYFAVGANNPPMGTGLDLSLKSTEKAKGTPNWFGGFTLNVNPIKKLNIGISGYYFDNSVMTTTAGQGTTTGVITAKSADNIAAKTIFNGHVNYKLHDNVALGVNVRNLLNNSNREGWGTDRIGRQFLFSLIVEY